VKPGAPFAGFVVAVSSAAGAAAFVAAGFGAGRADKGPAAAGGMYLFTAEM